MHACLYTCLYVPWLMCGDQRATCGRHIFCVYHVGPSNYITSCGSQYLYQLNDVTGDLTPELQDWSPFILEGLQSFVCADQVPYCNLLKLSQCYFCRLFFFLIKILSINTHAHPARTLFFIFQTHVMNKVSLQLVCLKHMYVKLINVLTYKLKKIYHVTAT